jgi:hypothetical protein
MGTTWDCNVGFNFWIAEKLDALSSVYKISMTVRQNKLNKQNANIYTRLSWKTTTLGTSLTKYVTNNRVTYLTNNMNNQGQE